MRLFVAVETPEPVRQEIARLRARLAGALPKARWVRPETVHLTLVFLGETGEATVPALASRLGAVFAARAPFELAVRGAGTFPPRRPARVAWLGVTAGPDLAALQAAVAAAAVEVAGIEPERRPYHPHLTLARPSRPWPRSAVERFLEVADRPIGEPFTVNRGVLMESHLGPGGARHEVVSELPLASGEAP